MAALNKDQSMALNLSLSGHRGTYVGFFHSGGNPEVKGWWERKDGSEGGMLKVCTIDGEVSDFDGGYDLPTYVREELKRLNVEVNF
jgi:hypothetical protein